MADNGDQVRERIDALISGRKNLVIGSVMDNGQPLVSQTPFAVDADGNFLVLVSGLAEHAKTLARGGTVSIMLMVDEAGTVNPYARERLNYDCKVEHVERDGDDGLVAENLFKQRFGKFIDTLLQLPDFRFYRLSPVEGRYVAGFGSAYLVRGNQVEQLRG